MSTVAPAFLARHKINCSPSPPWLYAGPTPRKTLGHASHSAEGNGGGVETRIVSYQAGNSMQKLQKCAHHSDWSDFHMTPLKRGSRKWSDFFCARAVCRDVVHPISSLVQRKFRGLSCAGKMLPRFLLARTSTESARNRDSVRCLAAGEKKSANGGSSR